MRLAGGGGAGAADGELMWRLVVLAAATLFAAMPVIGQTAVPSLAPGEALLSVEATGSVRTRPDTMSMGAGTVSVGASAADAVAANAAMAQRVIAAIRSLGIEAGDVRTSSFSVQPRFEGNRDSDRPGPDGRPPRIVGYVVENRFQITLRDLANAERLIARLFEAGVNSVQGPSFSLADDRAARRAAERAAIAEARAQAENYAAAAGRRLGRIIRISHQRSSTDSSGEAIIVTGSRIRATPIEPGEIETEATIFVDFALAPQ